MKHPNQIRNFFRHAQKVGLGFALLTLVFDLFTADDFYYDDNGVSISSETLYL